MQRRGIIQAKLSLELEVLSVIVLNATPYKGRKYNNKKFWEEFIAYFPFLIISVSHTSRKKCLVCRSNEFSETIQFGRLQCWHY
jgi:hypothetical protein